ncbi:MAG: hypothetical protein JWO62_947 [Acidimicrobiaceae bacterium]|nr:hypothetical protein [Acidimicrobiaceae bacterium]
MIRFALLQSRIQTVVGIAGLAIVAVVAAITGPHLVHLFDTNVAPCSQRGNCSGATAGFVANDHLLQGGLNSIVLLVPALIGIFWGAPLVARELETGTFRLVWTQSVTRNRWLAVKLGVVGLMSMAVAGLFSLMATWWSSPFDRANMNRFSNALFGERGLTPIGYAGLAFALGVTAGVVIRRSLPAMATTLVAFIAARLAVAFWIRPHLIAPKIQDFALSLATTGYGSSNAGPASLVPNPQSFPNAWVYSTQIVNKVGSALTPHFVAEACPRLAAIAGGPGPGSGSASGSRSAVLGPAPAGVQSAVGDCIAKVGATFHEVVAYQPASRYWAFQWYEMAVCLGAAVILAGISVWWLRRRIS